MLEIVLLDLSAPPQLAPATAAFCRVCSVTEVFVGSSRRSSWARRVDMRRAIAVLVRPTAVVSCSICQASTSFSAWASTSSRMPSWSR